MKRTLVPLTIAVEESGRCTFDSLTSLSITNWLEELMKDSLMKKIKIDSIIIISVL